MMSVLIWPNPPFVSQREHKREGEASFGSTARVLLSPRPFGWRMSYWFQSSPDSNGAPNVIFLSISTTCDRFTAGRNNMFNICFAHSRLSRDLSPKKKPTFVSVFLGNAHYLMKQTNCTTLWQRKQLSISRSCPCAQADEEVGG